MQFWTLCLFLLAFLFGYAVRNTPPEVKIHRWRVASFAMLGSLTNAMVWFDKNLVGNNDAVALRNALTSGPLLEYIFENSEALAYRLNLKIEYRTVKGVNVLISTPQGLLGKDDNTGLVYFHGGGWIAGNIKTYRGATATYANITNTVVISVEYRLAPENPYPAGFNDCLEVTRYVLAHAEEFGVNPKSIVVGGDSAGGNFAAAVSQYLIDNNTKSPLKGLLLIYPAVQFIEQTLPSRYNMSFVALDQRKYAIMYAGYMGLLEFENYEEAIFSNQVVCPEMWNDPILKYLDLNAIPSKYKSENFQLKRPGTCNRQMFEKIKDKLFHPYISPLFAPEVSRHPPTFIVAAEADIIRDDAYLYAHRLEKARVDVTFRLYDGAIHGFAHTVIGWLVNPTQYRMFEEDLVDWFDHIRR